jgi:hypothetical protein
MNALFESLEYENETTNTKNIGIMNLKRNCGDPVMFDSKVEIPEVNILMRLAIFPSYFQIDTIGV